MRFLVGRKRRIISFNGDAETLCRSVISSKRVLHAETVLALDRIASNMKNVRAQRPSATLKYSFILLRMEQHLAILGPCDSLMNNDTSIIEAPSSYINPFYLTLCSGSD
jgi:hypothetical protein